MVELREIALYDPSLLEFPQPFAYGGKLESHLVGEFVSSCPTVFLDYFEDLMINFVQCHDIILLGY